MARLRGNRAARALDRSATPALWATSLLQRRRRKPARIARLGVLKTNAIGDTILLSAVIADLRRALPDTELVLFAGPANAAVARLLEGVKVVQLPLARLDRAVRATRAERLDAMLDFGAWPRLNAVLAATSGAKYNVGFKTKGQGRHYCYDLAVDHSDRLHELENYRALARAFGVESTSLPSFRPPGETELPAQRYAVFHLWPGGYRSELKEWPLSSWRELAGRVGHNGTMIVLTGAPSDRERTERAAAEVNGLNAAGRYTFPQLVDVLGNSECVVSVNTGLMHLAAASGAPTVGLNGPTAEHRWGPVGARVRSVNSTYAGCGYLHLGSEYRGHREDCMAGISVEAVAAAIEEVSRDA
jgi:ADP-heptose:LPS heptosyltransferase